MLRFILAMVVVLGMAVAAEARCVGRVCQIAPVRAVAALVADVQPVRRVARAVVSVQPVRRVLALRPARRVLARVPILRRWR